MSIYTKKLSTPAGSLIMGADDNGICLFDYEFRKTSARILQRVGTFLNKELKAGHHPYHDLLEEQVGRYFEGTLTAFDLPLQLAGSSFQIKVWEALLKIPYGETRSYKQQSLVYGDEKAIRAVAGANGANAISIIVPCHRVVGSNQSLTGYAGGIASKKWLLEHERKHHSADYQQTLF